MLILQRSSAGPFIRRATKVGIGGEGFLWFGADGVTASDFSDPLLDADPELKASVLNGFFGVAPSTDRQSAAYQGFRARQHQLPRTLGDGGMCNLETDDEGSTYLYAADRDNNASTPLACAGYDRTAEGVYDPFAYDAVFAIAHALHELLEVQNRTEVVGAELLDTLIKHVRFDGVTGLVDFYDASHDPDRLYSGDRRVGVSYALMNYDGSAGRLVSVGLWTACAPPCTWSDRWSEEPGASLVFSTADNSRPLAISLVSCPTGTVRTVSGFCGCDRGYLYDPASSRCELCPVGKFKAGAGNAETCSSCEPGTHAPFPGSSSCLACDVGFYQPFTQQSKCIPCRFPGSSLPGSTSCDVCAPGMYQAGVRPSLDDFNETAAGPTCHECPEYFECPLNTHLSDVLLLPGYWRLSSEATIAYPCAGNGSVPCSGGRLVGEAGADYCSGNSSGPLCEACPYSHYFDSDTFRCSSCADLNFTDKLVLFGAVVGVLVLLWLAMTHSPTLREVSFRVHHLKVVPALKMTIAMTQARAAILMPVCLIGG